MRHLHCPKLGYEGHRPVEEQVLNKITREEIRQQRLEALMREITPKTKLRRHK